MNIKQALLMSAWLFTSFVTQASVFTGSFYVHDSMIPGWGYVQSIEENQQQPQQNGEPKQTSRGTEFITPIITVFAMIFCNIVTALVPIGYVNSRRQAAAKAEAKREELEAQEKQRVSLLKRLANNETVDKDVLVDMFWDKIQVPA